jgi:quercetin dioxygenase-like cupin family protein
MSNDRLRRPPAERFAGATHIFSIDDALSRLRAENHPAREGHRQITLLHRPPVTQVLFSFDAGGHLDRHSAQGLVTIYVLDGRLGIAADGVEHELRARELIVLDPDIPHDVRASEPAAMLLTVQLNR